MNLQIIDNLFLDEELPFPAIQKQAAVSTDFG